MKTMIALALLFLAGTASAAPKNSERLACDFRDDRTTIIVEKSGQIGLPTGAVAVNPNVAKLLIAGDFRKLNKTSADSRNGKTKLSFRVTGENVEGRPYLDITVENSADKYVLSGCLLSPAGTVIVN